MKSFSIKTLLVLGLFFNLNMLAESEKTIDQAQVELDEIIKKAKEGHPEEILKLVQYYAKNENFEKSEKWGLRFLIRGFQDLGCIKDEKIREVTYKKFENEIDKFKQFEEKNKDEDFDMMDTLDWALERNKNLPDPYWIIQYCEECNQEKVYDYFIEKNHFNKKRKEKIKEFKVAQEQIKQIKLLIDGLKLRI